MHRHTRMAVTLCCCCCLRVPIYHLHLRWARRGNPLDSSNSPLELWLVDSYLCVSNQRVPGLDVSRVDWMHGRDSDSRRFGCSADPNCGAIYESRVGVAGTHNSLARRFTGNADLPPKTTRIVDASVQGKCVFSHRSSSDALDCHYCFSYPYIWLGEIFHNRLVAACCWIQQPNDNFVGGMGVSLCRRPHVRLLLHSVDCVWFGSGVASVHNRRNCSRFLLQVDFISPRVGNAGFSTRSPA